MTDGLSREERTPCLWLLQSAHLGATGLIPHTPEWFLLSTFTLCDTTLCDRSATRTEGPGPPFLHCKGQRMCGTCHRTQGCSPTQKGMESSSATLPNVWCVINFRNRVKNPGNLVGI